jgi:uncharacterized repeat protein (TIGR04052 family)
MNRLNRILMLTTVATIAACDSGDDTPAETTQAVVIQFAAKVGTETFSCGQTAGYALGTGTLPWKPKDLRFYVHDVKLVTAAGAKVPVVLDDEALWQNAGVALLDFEDNTGTCNVGTTDTNTTVRGKVDLGTYVGLEFKVGVPVAQNHLNYQVAHPPLANYAMYWSWTGGYKFMKIDGTISRPAGDATANFHLGSTSCTVGTPGDFSTTTCAKLNVPEVSFAAFNVATQKVVLDLDHLFMGSNFDVEGGGAPGCMSGETPTADPECPALFAAIGLPFAANPAVAQMAFRAE